MNAITRPSTVHRIPGALVTAAIACGFGFTIVPVSMAVAQTGGKSAPKTMQELVQAAQKEGEIDFIDSHAAADANLLRDVEKSMNAKYGTTIRINATGGPTMAEMVRRIIEEHRAHKPSSTDLIRVTTRQSFQLEGTGATEEVDWRAYDPGIRPEEITGDGSGLISYADRVGIAYNTKFVPPAMIPKNVADLSDAKYKGMIGTTPYGTGWAEVAMLYGSDQTWKWAQGMAPNVAGFTASNSLGPVITGQLPILSFTGDASGVLLDKEKGAPIDMVFPFQAYEFNSVNMLTGSSHPYASCLFALFLRTPEGQKILWKYNRQDSPFLADSHEYREVQEAKEAGQKVLLYTEADVQKDQAIFNKLVPAIDKLYQNR